MKQMQKMEEVKALDEEWDKTAEAMATAKSPGR